MLHVPISPPHRYEQYAAEQGPGERCFDDLFITLGGSLVSSQQRRDVERHLCDGAERGVHHRSHCEVTLGGNAVGTKTKIWCTVRVHEEFTAAPVRPFIHIHLSASEKQALPGYTHANEIRQRNDGGDGRGKLGLCADVSVFMVNIANNQSD